MFLDIEAGLNVDHDFSMLYREVEPPREVVQIRCRVREQDVPVQVTGWDNLENRPCPAQACRVEESGDGVALLIFGGSGGLRLKELEDDRPWDVHAEGQWPETHLVYPRDAHVVYRDEL
ncbi:MAG: hypothetical protein ACE5ER_04960 [Nitrospinaceae bacterium]